MSRAIHLHDGSLDALLNSASSYSAQYNRPTNNTTISARYDTVYAMNEQHKTVSIAQLQQLTQAELAWKDADDAMEVARENAKLSLSVAFQEICSRIG